MPMSSASRLFPAVYSALATVMSITLSITLALTLIVTAGAIVGGSAATAQTDQEDAAASETVVTLPPMVVEGDGRWRLPDEVKDELWLDQQRDVERLLRERARAERDGALLTTGGSGRLRFELLPLYEPTRARAVEIEQTSERSEIVEVFRFKF